MLTIERQIEYGKRKTAELKAKLADPVTAKIIEQQVTNGNALLSIIMKRKRDAEAENSTTRQRPK